MPAAMSNPDWRSIEEHLDALLDLPEQEREARLNAIGKEAPADAFALRDWLANIERARLDPLTHTHDDQRVGPWRALRRIGRGGMGDVWLGERADGSYEQRVAIKFLFGDSPLLRARLDTERRLLAQLQHPGITRLIDGGVTAYGQPYLITEYIDGQALDRWCRTNTSDFAARIGLFRQVCAAVAHAHDQLIVHRDIKPNNILIDGERRTHLLDFGIARLLDDEGQGDTVNALTPDYAAPEQVKGGSIGVRTDVYALGALLYFLIAGRPPLDLRGAPLSACVQRICEEAPTPPSITGSALPLPRPLAGDLDAIVLKALAKSPRDRYPTVDRLLNDLDRALCHRPVDARRHDGVLYRARRYLRRHALALGVGTAVALILVAGLVVAVWQALNAAEQARIAEAERNEAQVQRDRAREEALRNDQVHDFLVSLLGGAAPDNHALKVGELLALAGKRVLESPRRSADQRGALIATLIEVYSRRNDPGGIEALLQPLLTAPGQELSADSEADLACKLGSAKLALGRNDEAASWIDRGLEKLASSARSGGDAHAYCMNSRANWNLVTGNDDEALSQYRRAIAEADPHGNRNDAFVAKMHGDYALALARTGSPGEAKTQYLLALDMYRQDGRADSSDATSLLAMLSACENQLGMLTKALEDNARAIEQELETTGPTSNIALELGVRAALLLDAGRPRDALDAIERARTMVEERSPAEVVQYAPQLAMRRARAYAALGATARAEREFDEAEKLFDRSGWPRNSIFRTSLRLYRAEAEMAKPAGPAAARAALAQMALLEPEILANPSAKRVQLPRLRMLQAQAALRTQDLRTAASKAGEARALYQSFSAAAGWQLSVCDAIIAQTRLAMGEKQTGLALLRDALSRMKTSLGPDHPRVAQWQALVDAELSNAAEP